MLPPAPQNSPSRRLRPRPRPARRGVALVLTLGLLALMLVLVTAILDTSRDGLQETAMVKGQDQARRAAQDAVAVALGQLRVATGQHFSSGRPRPWTSQPGAIRVHQMDGSLDTVYKLYSAASMTTADPAGIEKDDLPDDWAEQPDVFVDLNAPVESEDGRLRFPVVDPRAFAGEQGQDVEGFSYAEEKGAVGPGESADSQRLPMPVRWIYQLKDGTMGLLDKEGVFTGPGGLEATRENPIVSRFAFWVDDETSKININTASEGAYWDTPRADTAQERYLAASVPSRLEYMRQGGHPATVCLSSVLFPNRRIYPLSFTAATLDSPLALSREDARDLWRLGRLTVAERLENTAHGGQKKADWPQLWHEEPRESWRHARYATVEELMFDAADRRRFPGLLGGSPSAGRRRSQFFERHPEAVRRVQQGHFFLTAQNAAPEVTLYGTPRIATWPIPRDTLLNGNSLGNPEISRDTPYSHKVGIASTVGGASYVVQRSEPGDGIRDYMAHMGGANRKLLRYLQELTSQPVPGFARASDAGSTFLDKYGEDRDAILLGMMDYVRSTNFAEHQLRDTMQFSVLCEGVEHKGFGQISPMQMAPSTKPVSTSRHIQALGRILTISEVAMIVTCRAEVDDEGEIQGRATPAGREKLKNPGDREFDVGFLVEGFLPGQGWTDYRPYSCLALVGGAPGDAVELNHNKSPLPQYLLNGRPLIPKGDTTTSQSTDLPPKGWSGAGGSLGVRMMPFGVLQFQPVVIPAQGPKGSQMMQFVKAAADGNQLKVVLFDDPGSTSREDMVQVVPLQLPEISAKSQIPLPELDRNAPEFDLERRLATSAETGRPLVTGTDVVQSLAPLHGDYRLTATQRWAEVDTGSARIPLFVPHPNWGKQRLAHNLRDPALPLEQESLQGYVQGLTYAAAAAPDMPGALVALVSENGVTVDAGGGQGFAALDRMRLDKGLRGAALPGLTGDFDNGIGRAPDGPYSNRPDDGHWAAAYSGALPYFDNISQVGVSVPPVSLSAFSPQRVMPSPVMFGSLPTGTRAQVPWQTLLFRPAPGHYGARGLPDHLFLDLFWTPVLEPEPLSRHLETEGKVNLNHQILPFGHIRRATALHAALKAEALMAIPNEASATYKTGGKTSDRFRRHVDARQTLALWERELAAQKRSFLSVGQVCEMPLVPEGLSDGPVSREDMEAFWQRHRLTGDNSKERPYAHLYNKLTTRSNSYRIHFIAQSLNKPRSAPPKGFKTGRDRVLTTYAGSATLRRRLNTAHPDIPNYQDNPFQKSLERFYAWETGPLERHRN